MKNWIKTAAVLTTLALGAAGAHASVTLNVSAGDMTRADGVTPLPNGSMLAILVDADGNHSFGDISQAAASFGNAGDQLLGTFAVNYPDKGLDNPGSFQDSLVFSIAPSLEGKDIMLLWYDAPLSASPVGGGVAFGSYRDSSWVLPTNGNTLSENFLTQNEGGSLANSTGQASLVTTPEPASLLLVVAGSGLMFVRRRNRGNV